MSRFTADLMQLDQLIARIADFEATLQDRLTEIDGRVQSLSTSWTGQAAQDAARAHQEWRLGAAQMHHAVGAMHASLRLAHENYAMAISANRRGWST